MDCSVCHAKYVNSMTDNTLLVDLHVKLGQNKCNSCHELATLQKAHTNVQAGQTTVKATTFPQSFCLTCHGNYASLAKLTANSHALTDADGTVVNPHDVPQNTAHTSAKITECSNCHKLHQTSNAMYYCAGCHHEQVFECGTCHQM
jgi:hypothetical protein